MSAPAPPEDLARRSPRFIALPAGTPAYRFHDARRQPIHFDRGRMGRFNARGGEFGVLYASREPAGAFAETFLRRPENNLIAADVLAAKAFVRLRTSQDLRLIRLAGPGLARLGTTAEICHGGLPYDAPQAWAQAIWLAFNDAHGLAYTARHDDEQTCFAFFDRAADAIEVQSRETDLDQPWFWELADRYGAGLAPGG